MKDELYAMEKKGYMDIGFSGEYADELMEPFGSYISRRPTDTDRTTDTDTDRPQGEIDAIPDRFSNFPVRTRLDGDSRHIWERFIRETESGTPNGLLLVDPNHVSNMRTYGKNYCKRTTGGWAGAGPVRREETFFRGRTRTNDECDNMKPWCEWRRGVVFGDKDMKCRKWDDTEFTKWVDLLRNHEKMMDFLANGPGSAAGPAAAAGALG